MSPVLGWLARGLRWPLSGREAEHRARRSEERLSLALDAGGMAIWEMDADTGVMWWSEQAGRIFGAGAGLPAGPARLTHVLRYVHPDDRAEFQAAVARAVENPGGAHRVQCRVVRPDGTLRWIEARGQAWVGEHGRLRGLRGSLLDVTDLKRVEEGLRRALDEQWVIAAVAEAAAAAVDEEELLARTTAFLRDAFFPEHCGFLLADARNERLQPARSFRSRRSPEELVPIPFGRGVEGEVAASGVARLVEDAREGPEPLDPELRSLVCVPLKAGSTLLGVFEAGSVRLSAFTEADSRLLTVLGSHVAEAVARLRSAEALRESGELYRAYFSASPIALFVSDTRGRYLEVNGAACALTGYGRGELVGMSIADILAGEGAAETADRLVGLLALGPGGQEIRIRRKDGSTRHCLVHASTIDSDRLLGLLLDITDRKEAEEKLRDGEDRFRGLSEAAFEAILVHDGGGRIVDVNQALCELGGYAWHELVGRDGFELIAPEYRELVYRNLLAEYARPYEIECLRRDGTRLPVELQARSFPFRGQVQRVVALRDVSERRKAEAVRESLIRELEAKNAELERFGYTVTHDLKAPLVTIRGFADYLERDAREGRSDRLAADARRITEAVGRLQRLLDELFELSRAGRPVGPPAAVPAADLVQDALRLLRGRRSTGRFKMAESLPVVFGDRARLVQVFEKLLDNAVKFSGASGEPVVSVEAGPPVGGMAVLVVRDNGIGIEPRHRERVFGPFEKLDPRGEGSGVGLAMVKRIVESHGGRVWLESDGIGEGTAACVTLPLAEPAARRAAEPPAAAERLAE